MKNEVIKETKEEITKGYGSIGIKELEYVIKNEMKHCKERKYTKKQKENVRISFKTIIFNDKSSMIGNEHQCWLLFPYNQEE